MFAEHPLTLLVSVRNTLWRAAAFALLAIMISGTVLAQDTGQKQQSPEPEGGPQGDIGPYAIPKKPDEAKPAPLPPPGPKKIEGMPDYTISVNVPMVNVDAMVLTKEGQHIPGLKKEHFRILE